MTEQKVSPLEPVVPRWASSLAEREAAARFLAHVIAKDTAYISHGEIQHGLSPDGTTWAPDLEARLLDEMRREDPAQAVALAYVGDTLAGVACVVWELQVEAPYVTLADLAVASSHRGNGVGAALVAFLEAEAQQRGLQWIFLESGLLNKSAHDFFERAKFRPVSKIFAKRLG